MTDTDIPSLPMGVVTNPVRIHGLRRQLEELDRIRAFAETLPEHDYARWKTSLHRLHQAVAMDLAVHEGTGTLGALVVAGYRP